MNSNGFIVGNVDTTVPEEPLVYFVNNPSDTSAKRLKVMDIKTEEITELGVYNSSDWNSSGNYDYDQQRIDACCVTHDKKYFLMGSTFGGWGTTGYNTSRGNKLYSMKIENSSKTNVRLGYATGGNSGYIRGIYATPAKPDGESGYAIVGYSCNGNNNVYDHGVYIGLADNINYGYKKISSSTIFGNSNYTPYVWHGNPAYEEYFVTSSNNSNRKVCKINFKDSGYNNTTIDLLANSPVAIFSITYLPKSKRYYLGGYDRGYLTRPYDGPLDSNCFDGAITLTYGSYTVRHSNGSNTSTKRRGDGFIRAFEFDDEIVVQGNRDTHTFYISPQPYEKYKVPGFVAIFRAGDTEWTKYDSDTAGEDQDWDDTNGDFDWNLLKSQSYLKYQHDAPANYYTGSTNVYTGNSFAINTPGLIQPYTQSLYWNGQRIDHFHETTDEEERVVQFGPLEFHGQISSVDYNSGIYDGDAYRFRNDSISGIVLRSSVLDTWLD